MPKCLICGEESSLNENGICKDCAGNIQNRNNSPTMPKYIVKQNLGKMLLLLLMGIGMVGLGVFVTFVVPLIGIVGTAFFAFCCYYCLKLIISRQNVLEISDEGFTDGSSYTSVGLVPWNLVTGIHLSKMSNQVFIGVDVENLDMLLGKLSTTKRKEVIANLKLGYSPINITLNGSNAKIDDVLAKMNEYFNAYKEKQYFGHIS